MKVKVLKEAGYEEALLGLSLSYNSEPSKRVADNLAHKQGGHNKFLESVVVWLDIDAPRYWWSQADTYRLSTKQSESTMHCLMRNELTQEDFEGGVHEGFLESLNYWRDLGAFETLKGHLPESFLQRRIWVVNYKVLQNMVHQRENHKLPEWHLFCKELKDQLKYKEWVWNE